MNRGLEYLGRSVVRFITRNRQEPGPVDAKALARLKGALRPGDVLLVEGSMKVSTAIKYLTQSTWSHAALYVGDTGRFSAEGEPLVLAEVEMDVGCVLSPLSKYGAFGTRICRPQGLDAEGRAAVVAYALGRLGTRYDLKNIIDLMRWLVPVPLVPSRWRRRMIALGSGDPTRAICSTLIAQAFEAARYPVLPTVEYAQAMDEEDVREILHIRHHSLYMPRDFDISPYFAVVKPTLESGFDYRSLTWAQAANSQMASGQEASGKEASRQHPSGEHPSGLHARAQQTNAPKAGAQAGERVGRAAAYVTGASLIAQP